MRHPRSEHDGDGPCSACEPARLASYLADKVIDQLKERPGTVVHETTSKGPILAMLESELREVIEAAAAGVKTVQMSIYRG